MKKAAPKLAELLNRVIQRPTPSPYEYNIMISGVDYEEYCDTCHWHFLSFFAEITEEQQRDVMEIQIRKVSPRSGFVYAQRFSSYRDLASGKMLPFVVTDRGYARDSTNVRPMITWDKHLIKINETLLNHL